MRPIRPRFQRRPEFPRPRNTTTEQLLLLTGHDGVWLDPYDVEQYLREEKGVQVDGQSMFAEMTVPLHSSHTAIQPDAASVTDPGIDDLFYPPSPPTDISTSPHHPQT